MKQIVQLYFFLFVLLFYDRISSRAQILKYGFVWFTTYIFSRAPPIKKMVTENQTISYYLSVSEHQSVCMSVCKLEKMFFSWIVDTCIHIYMRLPQSNTKRIERERSKKNSTCVCSYLFSVYFFGWLTFSFHERTYSPEINEKTLKQELLTAYFWFSKGCI